MDVRSRQHQKVNLRSLMRTQWPIFIKLGMWVVGGTSATHVVCHHQMRIFNTSFAYLFWLANNKNVKYPEFCMGYIDETWYVGSGGGGHKYYPCGLSSPNAHIYLIPHLQICSDWLITKKKIKYPEFCMGYIDETWYVGSDGHKYYPCGLSSPNVHI